MNEMGNIVIRNIPEDIFLRLSEKAKKQNISREQYIRELLTSFATSELEEMLHNKYDTIIQQLFEMLQEQNEIIERNTLICTAMLEQINRLTDKNDAKNF